MEYELHFDDGTQWLLRIEYEVEKRNGKLFKQKVEKVVCEVFYAGDDNTGFLIENGYTLMEHKYPETEGLTSECLWVEK